jgi:hypothetical protein
MVHLKTPQHQEPSLDLINICPVPINIPQTSDSTRTDLPFFNNIPWLDLLPQCQHSVDQIHLLPPTLDPFLTLGSHAKFVADLTILLLIVFTG